MLCVIVVHITWRECGSLWIVMQWRRIEGKGANEVPERWKVLKELSKANRRTLPVIWRNLGIENYKLSTEQDENGSAVREGVGWKAVTGTGSMDLEEIGGE